MGNMFEKRDGGGRGFKNRSPQPGRCNGDRRLMFWESDPIGLVLKLALQCHFEPVVVRTAALLTWDFQEELNPAKAWEFTVNTYYPGAVAWYAREMGGRGLLDFKGNVLTGEILYRLVVNAGLYDYDLNRPVGMRGINAPSRRWFRNHPEWTQRVGPFKEALVWMVERTVKDAVELGVRMTDEKMLAIGGPFLAWRARARELGLPAVSRTRRTLAHEVIGRLL